ncbi:phosphoribosyl-AMP cyclohydrolase [Polynucleobacter rarus]|uniref:phosphoribosyl-AMP cyclohydrolase n=1 Tax=Polynucleobacter rarus TaxID=556055 RepID=UPI000D3EAF59|nr:phosphoribosyl-AMP cyclohydrolase [Polynucleobacter rarus]
MNTSNQSTNSNTSPNWLDAVKWNSQGLVPAIAQEVGTNKILMMAWMNLASLQETVELGQAVYWSRSRGKRWHKGEESGHFQKVKEILLDCDGDTIVLMVEQTGVACHTGAHSCFFNVLDQTQTPYVWQVENEKNDPR